MKEIYKLAEEYHQAGNNCVESVVKACNKGLELNLPDQAIRMISGMGGGIGRSGCVCGALSGSAMVISSLVGRLDPSEKHQTEVYKYTHEFYERFYAHFGSACCSQLNKLSFGTPEYRTKCIKLTAEAADMVSDYIMEKGLLEFKR